jgi:hypothetical protein
VSGLGKECEIVVEVKMKSRREALRRRVQTARKTHGVARRYGAELKRDVTEYGRERQREGATIVEIAEELELSADSLRKWMRWAKLLTKAGKIPFEHSRRSPSRVKENTQREVDSECQQEECTQKTNEVLPTVSEGNLLICVIEPSGVKLEQVTKKQLSEWILIELQENDRND